MQPHFEAFRAAGFLGYVSTRFAQLETEFFAHSSWQNSSSSVRLDGERLRTTVFRSCLRFSVGFRSGRGLSHSHTWICFVLHHSIVALVLCSGSSSCWKVNLRPSLKSFADSNRFSFWPASFGGQPCLGAFAVVPYSFHYWMMDWTVLCEMFKAWEIFLWPNSGLIFTTPQLYPWPVWCVPWTSWCCLLPNILLKNLWGRHRAAALILRFDYAQLDCI